MKPQIVILERQLKEIQDQLNDLKKQPDEQPDKWPQDGDNYFFINSLGNVLMEKWSRHQEHQYRELMNNVFANKHGEHGVLQAAKDKIAYAKYCADADVDVEIVNSHAGYSLFLSNGRAVSALNAVVDGLPRFSSEELLFESLKRHGKEAIIRHIQRGLR